MLEKLRVQVDEALAVKLAPQSGFFTGFLQWFFIVFTGFQLVSAAVFAVTSEIVFFFFCTFPSFRAVLSSLLLPSLADAVCLLFFETRKEILQLQVLRMGLKIEFLSEINKNATYDMLWKILKFVVSSCFFRFFFLPMFLTIPDLASAQRRQPLDVRGALLGATGL